MNSQIRKEYRKKILKTLQYGVGGEGAFQAGGKIQCNVCFVLWAIAVPCKEEEVGRAEKLYPLFSCIPKSRFI